MGENGTQCQRSAIAQTDVSGAKAEGQIQPAKKQSDQENAIAQLLKSAAKGLQKAVHQPQPCAQTQGQQK